jgi:DNA-binding MarR family transcriptional regulator
MRIRFDECEQGRDTAAIDMHRERTDRLEIPPARVLRDPVRRDIRTEVLRGTAGDGRRRRGRGLAQWGRFQLTADSVGALRETGIFGTVELSDLTELFEAAGRAKRTVQELERENLLRVERFQRGSRRIEAVTLTSRGRRLLERCIDPRESGNEDAQAYLSGCARSAQVLHDTAVYRAARCEMRRISAEGGTVRRIRTERQLRRIASCRMDAAKRRGEDCCKARVAAAAELQLTVTHGKLSFPDVRIEWERSAADESESGFVDVEVTTADYRERSLSEKSAAGYQIYEMATDGRVSRQGHC